MTALIIAIMYLVPLAALAWLFAVKPGYALIACMAVVSIPIFIGLAIVAEFLEG